MPDTKISSADVSDYTNTITNFSVDATQTDAAQDQAETPWINDNWSQQLGYYKNVAELQSAIDAKARWSIGKGFTANEVTTIILSKIKGFGKDTFNSIIENMIRVYHIGGDSYSEIITDEKGRLINLKPLDPTTIRIIASRKGIIKRYEQVAKVKGMDKKLKKENILHFSRNRVADEIHGVSLVDAVEWIILAKREAQTDYKRLLHRNIYPLRIWHLDTDNPSEITAFKAKVALAKENFEDMFVPKGAVVPELAAVPANATLNPLPWINQLDQKFYQVCGVPQIVVGGSGEMTEATAKICYLAFEQTIEEEQLYIEEQILAQLNLEIELEFPASLQNEMLSDTGKEESMQAATPEDTTTTPAEVTKGMAK